MAICMCTRPAEGHYIATFQVYTHNPPLTHTHTHTQFNPPATLEVPVGSRRAALYPPSTHTHTTHTHIVQSPGDPRSSCWKWTRSAHRASTCRDSWQGTYCKSGRAVNYNFSCTSVEWRFFSANLSDFVHANGCLVYKIVSQGFSLWYLHSGTKAHHTCVETRLHIPAARLSPVEACLDENLVNALSDSLLTPHHHLNSCPSTWMHAYTRRTNDVVMWILGLIIQVKYVFWRKNTRFEAITNSHILSCMNYKECRTGVKKCMLVTNMHISHVYFEHFGRGNQTDKW